MDALLLVLRVVLAAVFVVAAAGKLLDRDGSRQALVAFGVGERLAAPGAIVLPLAELAVALALLPAASAVPGAAGAIVLLTAFSAGIGRAMARGEAPDCHCFGQLHSEPAGPKALVRNVVLAAPAVIVVVAGPGPQPTVLGFAAILAGLAAVGALAVWMHKRSIAKAEREAAEPAGLPVGAQAPTFALARLRDGDTVRLDDLWAEGRPALLVFTHPGCGPCNDLMPDLRRWQRSLSDRVTIALVSQGGEADNHEAHAEHPLDNILLEGGKGNDVYKAYRMRGTPSAVAVGPDGRIATVTAEGELLIEQLTRLVLQRFSPAPSLR
ncbi:MAG TPA: MauE/DoxX family redox-associated membrane protein [Solirubrobacteraceae bacterium]|nr:MauE/DoxX family redox-associated membrane protein [Solirubrobacteraceae bacterium]